MKERLTLKEYEIIPEEYNTVNQPSFLMYNLDEQDFQYCAKAQQLRFSLFTTDLQVRVEGFCDKQKAKVYLDWLLEEKRAENAIMLNTKIELVNSELAMLIYKVYFLMSYSFDNKLQLDLNMPVALRFCATISKKFQELFAFVEAIDYKSRCFYVSLFRCKQTVFYLKNVHEVDVYAKSNSFDYKSMLCAIDLAASRSIYSPLLFPQPTYSDKFLVELLDKPQLVYSNKDSASFNELQQRAIQEIAFSNLKYPFVLFGPPVNQCWKGCSLNSYKLNKRLMVMLEVSYRCHPEILRISSKEFYDGKLVPHDKGKAYHRVAKWAFLPKPGFPIIFESVVNCFEDREGNSYFNQIEVEHVTNYVRLLLTDGIAKKHEIGVISPYRAQTERLRNELRAYEGLTVDSVERFQGSERPVIILTTVRTKGLGFLTNEKVFS